VTEGGREGGWEGGREEGLVGWRRDEEGPVRLHTAHARPLKKQKK
jgi:hypothetical protein